MREAVGETVDFWDGYDRDMFSDLVKDFIDSRRVRVRIPSVS